MELSYTRMKNVHPVINTHWSPSQGIYFNMGRRGRHSLHVFSQWEVQQGARLHGYHCASVHGFLEKGNPRQSSQAGLSQVRSC